MLLTMPWSPETQPVKLDGYASAAANWTVKTCAAPAAINTPS